MIRINRFVCGCIQRQLLAETDLTFKNAIEIAQTKVGSRDVQGILRTVWTPVGNTGHPSHVL